MGEISDPIESTAVVRPASVTVLGIIAIVFGLLNIISVILTVFLADLFQESLKMDYPGWFKFSQNTSLIISNIAMVCIGICLLKFMAFSRKALITYSLIEILHAIIIKGMMFYFAMQLGENKLDVKIEGISTAIVGLIAAMLFPVAALWFMTRKKVINAYDRLKN